MLYSHVTLLMLRVVDVITKTSVQQSARMLVGELPGDIQIGALFPMHRQIAGAEGCGAIWEQYGIQRAEVAMLTVQQLNRILPFRLGISIRDSCWTERIAMEQTIAFLREGVTQCSCCQTAGCQKKVNPVVAIVGPAKSSTTIAVQNLLQVFRIPQIGYAATTTDLSDKESFGYYLRVVPSDGWQAMAINQVLMHFNWTYIAVVYSAGNYGEKGFEAMERLTHIPGIDVCIAYAQKVKSLGDPEEFENVLLSLNKLSPRPRVVVCFCEGLSMRKMFQAQKVLRIGKVLNNTTTEKGGAQKPVKIEPFQWIGSDSWADRLDVVDGVESEAAGSFSIRIHSPRVENFEPYYFSLNPAKHTKNPWFREFWQQKFKCLLTVPKDDTHSKLCDIERQNLTMGYEQDPKLSQVMNAIRVVGYALRDMYEDKCPSHRRNGTFFTSTSSTPFFSSSSPSSFSINAHFGMPPCPEMETINGTLLFRYMMNVSFEDEFQQEISFDDNGDPPAWYDILNYVGFAGFRLAGDFRQTALGTHHLRMSTRKLMFFNKTGQMPESVCSKPCNIGHKRRQTTACCWICEQCKEAEILVNNICQKCPFGEWPAPNRTSCVPLEHEYMEMSSATSMLAIAFASLGIICTIFCILVFVLHNSTPVVKSTTRELSYIILGGIVASYLCTFVVLARPSFLACFVSRTLPPIAFSTIYSALFTKTNRIARILAGSKKRILTKKPRFLSTFSQVVITWSLVGVQCVIVAVGVMEEMPHAGFDANFAPRRMVLTCASSVWAFRLSFNTVPFMWNFILVLFCTLYAFKTRNLPENFNEAKFIGFTMYCTLVTWGAFVVLYFNAVNKALTASFTFSISASIALSLLFFPKIFIILLRPEKNVRSSYTTTKLIRCHFGNAPQSGEFKDSKHISLSKTRNSSQSLSIGGSCPTRTASLHVVNNQSHSSTTNQSASSTAGATQSQHPICPRRDIQTQTEMSSIAFISHGGGSGGLTSRFSRTFSVMGNAMGGVAGGGGNAANFTRNIGVEEQQQKGGVATAGGEGEKKSRRKTLDEDVMQLIDSCRRYQDERLLINPSTIENLLLEETEEGLMSEENEGMEKVTQLLAGTVRSLAQTVSRTAGSTPKISSSSMYSQQEANGSQKEYVNEYKTSSSSAPMPTRSSIKSAKDKPTMHVDFAGNGKREKEKIGEGKNPTKFEAENSENKVVEDSFEQLLRSKGFNPLNFTNPTQL